MAKNSKSSKKVSKKDVSEHEDQHVKLYKKQWHEVKKINAKCPVCGQKIDEFGYCSCGTGG